MLCTSVFVDDVTFAHNRPTRVMPNHPRKGDAKRAYAHSGLPRGRRTGSNV